jgi:class 3 adenylate cyclase
VVDSAGDGLVAEFSSAVAAVQYSVRIREELTTRERGAAGRPPQGIRIGVDLGGVIYATNRLAGRVG